MDNKELHYLIKSVIDLNKKRYLIIKDEIDYIINNNIKNENQIERKLDEMLDILSFYENDDTLLTFRKLCKYYFNINPRATVDYINFYREQNDPEGVKFGNRNV